MGRIRIRHRAVIVTAFVFLGSVTACAKGSPGEAAPAREGPVISEITPSDGIAGTAYPIRATIYGIGFAQTGNIVTFGNIRMSDLPSNTNGSIIVFQVPKEQPATSEVPPFVLQPGRYRVTVTTPEGTSNSVTFELRRG